VILGYFSCDQIEFLISFLDVRDVAAIKFLEIEVQSKRPKAVAPGSRLYLTLSWSEKIHSCNDSSEADPDSL
jgi:hypothetical protein